MRIVLLLLIYLWNAPAAQAEGGLPASASASGRGMMVVGPEPANMSSTQSIDGSITISSVDMGNRWSHVQNTDRMNVETEFTSEDGAVYRVIINTPMPRHPNGKYTTWFGAVYWHEMHGDTGIGSPLIPKVKPDIALWGWAEVSRNGQLIANMVPAHVMVMTQPPIRGVMLEVATEEKNLPGVPHGNITALWPVVTSFQMPTRQVYVRQIAGWLALLAVVALFGGLIYGERPRSEIRPGRAI